MKYLPRILRYVLPHGKLVAGSVVVTVLGALVGLLSPWPLAIMVDSVLDDGPLPAILSPLAAMVGDGPVTWLIVLVIGGLVIALLINGMSVADNYVNTSLLQYITLGFRSDLFHHAQRLSLSYYDQHRSGKLIYAINNQASAPAELALTFPPLAESALTLIGMFWISYRIDPQLALVSLVVVPFLYYSVGYYAKHIQHRLRKVIGMEGESLSIIHEAISMMRVIVAFGREDYEHRRFCKFSERAMDARLKVTVRQTLFSLVVNMITATGSALVLGLGAYGVLQGRLSVGDLLVVLAYIASVYKPLETMSHTVGSLQDKLICLEAAMKLLDTEPAIRDQPGATAIDKVRGTVRYENVNFSYAERTDTLQGIDFEARAGQLVAVVGPTGAGKTTLVSLLPRFYDAADGKILLDGRDIREITLRSLRDQISIVLQEPMLFRGTIADNIRYGRLEATEDEIMAAAKNANAYDFIMRLPKKFDTLLGERGTAISIGERQRISVARAFLKNAPILILDEPTSSVDSKTEAVILEALERLMVGRTTFMISHRLSTIRDADLILVVNQGRLVEQGTQEELMQADNLFKQLYDIQMRGGKRGKNAPRKLVKDPYAL